MSIQTIKTATGHTKFILMPIAFIPTIKRALYLLNANGSKRALDVLEAIDEAMRAPTVSTNVSRDKQ